MADSLAIDLILPHWGVLGQTNLVGDSIGETSALDGHAHGCRASSDSRAGKAEGVHDVRTG